MSLLSGWFEKRQPVMTDEGIQEKAPIHREIALQNQTRDTLRVPLPAPSPKIEIKPPEGWTHGPDNSYHYEQRFEKHTVDNIIESVYKGKVSKNHGLLQVFRYTKDLSDLSELERTLDELESRRVGMIIEDNGFPEVVARIHDVKAKIRELKKQCAVQEDSETLLDDYFRGAPDSEDYKEWAEGFMETCLSEVDRHSGHKSKLHTDSEKEEEIKEDA